MRTSEKQNISKPTHTIYSSRPLMEEVKVKSCTVIINRIIPVRTDTASLNVSLCPSIRITCYNSNTRLDDETYICRCKSQRGIHSWSRSCRNILDLKMADRVSTAGSTPLAKLPQEVRNVLTHVV